MRLVAVLCILLSSISMAQAQPNLEDLAERAFFGIKVEGTIAPLPPSSTREPVPPLRLGKAIAIGPNTLLAPLHIVGVASDWAPREEEAYHYIGRATPLLDRTIELWNFEADQANTDNFVLPNLSNEIDAAAIAITGPPLGTYFQLSLCPIIDGSQYTALVTSSDQPEEVESVGDWTALSLTAIGFSPEEFGSLYAFSVAPNIEFHAKKDGHEGSPILNRDNQVVAIVSAVATADNGSYLLLATPVQPLFPGAQSALLAQARPGELTMGRPQCSLAEAVQQLQDDVSQLIIWDVDFTHAPDDGKIDMVKLSYSGVSSALTEVEIRFAFWGIPDLENRPEGERNRIDYTTRESVLYFRPTASRNTFESYEIGKEGRDLAEPFVLEKAGSIGRVEIVKVYITPFFGDVKGVTTLKEHPWIISPVGAQ